MVSVCARRPRHKLSNIFREAALSLDKGPCSRGDLVPKASAGAFTSQFAGRGLMTTTGGTENLVALV
jgi:hypothetical protein